MGTKTDEERKRKVLALLDEGVTRPSSLAKHLGIPRQNMHMWLLRNGLDDEERRRISRVAAKRRAAEMRGIDPYVELKQLVAAAPSQAEFARQRGINKGELWSVLNGHRKVTPGILAAIGLRAVTVYLRTP